MNVNANVNMFVPIICVKTTAFIVDGSMAENNITASSALQNYNQSVLCLSGMPLRCHVDKIGSAYVTAYGSGLYSGASGKEASFIVAAGGSMYRRPNTPCYNVPNSQKSYPDRLSQLFTL